MSSILVILMVTVLSVVAAGFLNLITTETKTADSYRRGIAAQYMAEAGVNQAIAQLNRNPLWSPDGSFHPFDPAHPERGSYKTVITAGTGNDRTITATGQAESAFRQVVVRVRLASPGGGPPAYPYDYAAFCGGVQNLGDAALTGLAGLASRAVPVPTLGPAYGDTLPTFERLRYQEQGAAIASVSGEIPGGTYFVPGNLTVDTPVSGTGVIYATGNVSVNANISGKFMILAEGNVSVGTNSNQKEPVRIDGAVIVAGGGITVAGGTEIKGSLIAGRDITVHASSTLAYDAPTIAFFSLPNTRLPNNFQVLSWTNH